MCKQTNYTPVIGTIIVPKAGVLLFCKKRRGHLYVKKKVNADISFSASTP